MAEMAETNETAVTTMTPSQEYAALGLRDRTFIQIGGLLKNAGEFVHQHAVSEEGRAWLAKQAASRLEHVVGDLVSRKVAEILGRE